MEKAGGKTADMTNKISFGDRLDRWLLKKGFRAKWPLLALYLILGRRIVCDPIARLRYSPGNPSDTAASPSTEGISRSEGYRLFSADSFPELPQVVAACEVVFDRHGPEITDGARYNKPYFYNILTVEDLRQYPVLINFALSASVTEAVTGYLGQIPRLHSIGVFYSAVNDSIAGSQMFHVDGDALSQMKCFVNIWDVGVGGGAFTFLPKQHSSASVRSKGLLKVITDEEVARLLPEASQVAVVGSAGSGVFVDTSRCLHQGSRARTNPRLVFQFQYVTRPDVLLAQPGRAVAGGHLLITRQLLEGLSLANPQALMFVD
jgi:hypothetical protein